MDKHIIDEQTGIGYTLQGDKYLPYVVLPASPKLGRYGRLHLKYLRENKDGIYTGLLLSGKLNGYLEEIDVSAQAQFEQIVKQIQKQQGVTEKLKATNQLKWVGLMNNIRACADEAVLKELIYK